MIEAAGRVGQNRRKQPLRSAHRLPATQLRAPRRRRRIDGAIAPQRSHHDHGLLIASQPADVGGHHELPPAHERGAAGLDGDPPAVERFVEGPLLGGHPPGQLRRLDAHARWRRPTDPWREQASGTHEQALRCGQFVEASQADERREHVGQSKWHRTIDHRLHGHVGKLLRRAPLERSHDLGRIRFGVRLHEHRVDEIVVELRMLTLDGSRGVDEVHPVAHERHEPANGGSHQGQGRDTQPRPAQARRQATGHQPVLDENAEHEPRPSADRRAQDKGRERHALEIGARRGQPPGQIPIGLRFSLATRLPACDGEVGAGIGRTRSGQHDRLDHPGRGGRIGNGRHRGGSEGAGGGRRRRSRSPPSISAGPPSRFAALSAFRGCTIPPQPGAPGCPRGFLSRGSAGDLPRDLLSCPTFERGAYVSSSRC